MNLSIVTSYFSHAEVVPDRPHTYSINRYLFGQIILSVTYESSEWSTEMPRTDARLESIMLLFDMVEARDGMLVC